MERPFEPGARMSTEKTLDPEKNLESLTRLLRHLGWSKVLEKTPRPMAVGRSGAGVSASSWLALQARASEIPAVALMSPVEKPLTPLRRLYTQFEDLGDEVRQLLSGWRDTPGRPEFLLLTDGAQTLLFDVDTEECLASCEEPGELADQVLPHLDYKDVARGSLRNYPRRTVEDFGKELGAWIGHWMATTGASLGVERPNALELVQAVLLARLAERLGYAPGRQRIEDWAWEGTARKSKSDGGAGKILRRFWRPLDAAGFVTSRLNEKHLGALMDRLAPADLADRWLGSVSRLSWKRFRAEVFAVALADEELRHKSWQTMVTSGPPVPPGNLRNPEDSSDWLHAIWELDLDQVGHGPVLRALDLIVDGLKEYNLRQRAVALRGDRVHLQMDLFEPQPEGMTATLSLADPVGYALGHVLRVKTASADRARMMRFVLASRALELNEPSAPLLNPLPDLRKAVPDPG